MGNNWLRKKENWLAVVILVEILLMGVHLGMQGYIRIDRIIIYFYLFPIIGVMNAILSLILVEGLWLRKLLVALVIAIATPAFFIFIALGIQNVLGIQLVGW